MSDFEKEVLGGAKEKEKPKSVAPKSYVNSSIFLFVFVSVLFLYVTHVFDSYCSSPAPQAKANVEAVPVEPKEEVRTPKSARPSRAPNTTATTPNTNNQPNKPNVNNASPVQKEWTPNHLPDYEER
jgi:hypothetical protein